MITFLNSLMFTEHICELHEIETFNLEDYNPVHKAFHSTITPEPSGEKIAADGVLILFHGAPETGNL